MSEAGDYYEGLEEGFKAGLAHASSLILNEVRGMERGGSYARKKHMMYQGLARRVREIRETASPDASNE